MKLRILSFTALGAILTAIFVAGPQSPRLLAQEVAPAAAAASRESAQPALDELDAYIAQAQQQWPVPGLAVAIVKDGQVVLAKGYGVLEQGGSQPVDGETLFAIASNTKAFTAASLAMLVEEGKLKWSDRVQDHLPYFRLYDPYVSAEMRVEDLLCHRSGLGTYSGDLLWYGTPYSAVEVLKRTRYVPQAGPFRDHYGYSNLMFLAAGEIVAEASGLTWSQFVQQRILAPLEMNRTLLSTSRLTDVANVASPHKNLVEEVHVLPWCNWDTMAAAGGIISSANDMSRWLLVQLNEGRIDDEQRLFSADSSHRMWSPHTIVPLSRAARTRSPSTHFRAYGLGWSLADYHGRMTVSHGGGYDGMFSRVTLVPEEQLGVVVLTNSMTGVARALANRVVDHFLQAPPKDWSGEGLKEDAKARRKFYERISVAITPVAQDTQPSLSLEKYCGTYGGPMYGDAIVSRQEQALVLQLAPNRELIADLTHLHYDTFVVHWRNESAWFAEGTAHFVLDAKGAVSELRLDIPNDDFWFYELELLRRK